MKSINTAAMRAIERGEAIVTGAVEIIPPGSVLFEPYGTVNLNAVTNASTTKSGGLTAGVTISGFAPSDIVRFSMPSGGTYTAWNWLNGWVNEFDVIVDGDTAQSYRVSDLGVAPSSISHTRNLGSAAAAQAAFGERQISGGSSYTLYIYDSPIADNSGGLSIAIDRGELVYGVGGGSPIRLWGGHGPITFGGNTFQGIGDRGLAQRSAGAIGGVAQGMTLTLSGIEPAALDLLDGAEVKGASVIINRLIFASDGKTLLDYEVFDRGRLDTISTEEQIGGSAKIVAAVESAARGLGRSGARQRSDSDQRLINLSDGYFKNTAYAGEKMLYWGGRKPSRLR